VRRDTIAGDAMPFRLVCTQHSTSIRENRQNELQQRCCTASHWYASEKSIRRVVPMMTTINVSNDSTRQRTRSSAVEAYLHDMILADDRKAELDAARPCHRVGIYNVSQLIRGKCGEGGSGYWGSTAVEHCMDTHIRP
jgi:hypothetical protein